VASFSILGDLVRNVGGDHIDLRVLVPAGADTHTFEPTPADSAALAKANLIVEIGVGYEGWLDALAKGAGTRATRVAVTQGMDLIRAEAHADEKHEKHDEKPGERTPDKHAHDEHGSSEFDPHVWHDVQRAIHMTGVIRDALIQVDAANAARYRANADRYIAELQALDAWIVARAGAVPPERRKLVTSHDTFSYFARRYGFEIIGTALGSISTEASEPSAGAFAQLVKEIKAAGVPAIFAENVSNPKLMERLAAEAGVTLVPGLYTDALGPPGSAGDTYIKLMRHNVSTITTALSRA
jgi:ABC-type Zn uptake system ZnuABC Zn-binding protein ZnuA